MRFIRTTFGASLVLIASFSSVSGQAETVARAAQDTSQDTSQDNAMPRPTEAAEKNKARAPLVQDKPEIWIYLLEGRRMQVDDVAESADGVWFKRGNVSTFMNRERVERIERSSITKVASIPETRDGPGNWKISDSARVEDFFLAKFGRRLPLTAFGQSHLHSRWGYDHRQGMDVGLHPDSPEGKGLIEFLRREEIPFLAFREAVPGVATGPHIHIGNRSRRLPGR